MVGASDETTGQAVVAFVILKQSYLVEHSRRAGSRKALRALRSASRSARSHRPRDVFIVERAAQDPLGQDHAPPACATSPRAGEVGDTTTLADTAVMSGDLARRSSSTPDERMPRRDRCPTQASPLVFTIACASRPAVLRCGPGRYENDDLDLDRGVERQDRHADRRSARSGPPRRRPRRAPRWRR